jgi:AbrB family looped-hinge helix DNA binding protein
MNDVVTMSSKGQVVIPKELRDSLHLKAGTKFQVRVRGNEIVLARPDDWRTVYEQIVPSRQSLVKALLKERALDRKREDGK